MTSFKRRIQIHLARRIRKIYNNENLYPNDTIRTSASIFRLVLRDKDAEFILMPIKDKRILKIDKKGMYITLQKTILEITNHQFSYHIEIGFNLYTKLGKSFDKKLDDLSSEYEKQITTQMSEGLRKVLNTITE
jgi:hypothetical protein